ncbi:EAL domain-containing protein [Noviherbaspirillum denitrificans]|uniref:EAL domain-containing protein n=1 Tax=Noviherbaspirillum denitrificans TaxID=1968433 RepID=UPI001131B79C|nr:EAL domain-containing protein [Noviherbaspirillum denitrificans]
MCRIKPDHIETIPLRTVTPAQPSTARRSVRTYLTWLVLACLLPGVIGAAGLFTYEYNESRRQIERDTILTARALSQAVDHHLLRVKAVAQTLARSDALASGDFELFHQQARIVMAELGMGTNVVLRDEAGRQLINTGVDFGKPITPVQSPEQVRAVFDTGQPVISNLFIGPVLKQPIVSIDVPVFHEGKPYYALGIGILPEHFNRILKTQGLPGGWIGGVFDSTGTIVGRTHSPDQFIGKKASPMLLQRMLATLEGSGEATSVEGIALMTYHSRSPATGWTVAIGIPRSTVDGMLVRALWVLALGVVVLFAAGLALAWLMGGRIARAVTALTGPAVALGEGRAVDVPEQEIQETEHVAAALRRAGKLLDEHTHALNARDAELAEAHRLAKFGTWQWNLLTGEVWTSASVPGIYGRPVPSFPEQRGTLLPVESWERAAAAAQHAVETGEGYNLDLRVNHGSGEVIWINARCEAIRDAQGQVTGLRGTVQDISELKRTEERFRLLADNIAQLAWMADGTGNIFWYNRRWFDYTGTTLEQMQGWGWTAVHHPEHVERVVAKFRDCLRSGTTWEDTFPLRGVDGRYRWFLSRAVPEKDESGRVLRWFGTNTDITEQREVQEDLRTFKFFSDHANEIHFLVEEHGAFRYVNELACERLGYSREELLRMTVPDIDPRYTEAAVRDRFVRSRESRQPSLESAIRCKDGSTFPVEVTTTVLEVRGEWLMFAVVRDITERKLAEERVREAALHDVLTGLPNRALIMEYCDRLLAAAQRNHMRGALLFIDLDRFKPVNDAYGHEVGDRVLQEVGKRLATCTRQEDVVGRLGGDEFVIVLPYLDAGHRAALVAQHVIGALRQPFRVGAIEVLISASVGISYFPEHAGNAAELIHAADLAMYQVKQSGRSNYQFYTTELDERAELAHMLEVKLRTALRDGGLRLHYQPVVDLKSGKLVGAEALVRMEDKEGAAIGPDKFIPVAEATGLIADLGEWVAAEACRQHDAWLREGLSATIAINVSPLQFKQASFTDKLAGIIAGSGIDPSCLEIEVTESAVMENVTEAIEILQRIKSLGVKVALDDFGTGYSSLSSLSTLPLDKLKVDQSFVRRLERDPASRAVTEAIITLGQRLGLDVHGEGIESESTLRYLAAQGCDQAQGYWFSRPLPPEEFARWVREKGLRDRVMARG